MTKQIVEGARILVLDDEALVGELLQDILGLLGYRARHCASPLRALELLETEFFDLVISDFRMPQMSGEEFRAQAVAMNPALADRIIFITGDAMSDNTQYFFKTTKSPHLSKPFHFESIKQIIEQALERNAVGAAA